MDIKKLESFVTDVKGLQKQKWTSRKLWVTLGIVAGLIWLFKGSLGLILWQVTGLVALWLLCTTATDIIEEIHKNKIKMKMIEELGKDGLTPEEAEVVQKVL